MSEQVVHTGEVIFFSIERGYGFIAWSKDGEKQKDMFCHYSDIVHEGFKYLKAGQMVEFNVGVNYHDQPKAINVQILK